MSLTYRPGTPQDRAALVGLLRGLSPASSYSRFQAAVGTNPPPALIAALLPPPGPGPARSGVVLGWDGDALVAHGLWVRLGATPVAEIALLVADSHQRRGVGSALVGRVVAAARSCGITGLEAFSESGNRAVARMVARLVEPEGGASGAGVVTERSGATVTYRFAVPALPAATAHARAA